MLLAHVQTHTDDDEYSKPNWLIKLQIQQQKPITTKLLLKKKVSSWDWIENKIKKNFFPPIIIIKEAN